MPLLSLPLEIINMIVSELPCKDVLGLMCTNRDLHDLLIRDLYKRNLDTDPGELALYWCAMNGAMQGMRHLLSWKVDLNRGLTYEGRWSLIIGLEAKSALVLAIEDDNLGMVDLLLKHGADVNYLSNDYPPWDTMPYTPLEVAVGRGNAVMTLFLLQKGAKIRDQITLSRAIRHGGLLAWVEAGRYNKRELQSPDVPEVAFNYDFRSVVEVLHLYGANVNEVPLLHDAVLYYGSLDDGVIEYLLYLGADVHAMDDVGASVISRVFRTQYRDARGSEAFAKLLIAHGAKFFPDELTVLLENAILREKLEDLHLVLKYGVDVNSLWCEEGGCLHLVIKHVFRDDMTQEGFLRLLLSRGADVHLKDHESSTPLIHAVSFPWNINLAKPLLDAGAKVQCHGEEGAQLLNFLIRNGLTTWFDPRTDELQRFLKYLEDLEDTEDLEDLSEWEPFPDFSEMDAMIKLVLEYGVCPDYTDDSGQCPLDLPGAGLFSALKPWLSKRGKA
ncbi:hypothetical protein CBS147332_3216 [Penicillium roqueforti]|nr:hypothetical protein CBS147332_3216 [Penicillium roqueforti]KAI3125644.1 hypothetical protein CBS147331_638 [Penicillium roqueforti]